MALRPREMQDELELQMMAEAELARLKNQYRIMENSHIAYVENAKLQLRKQLNMINHLEDEKVELVLILKLAKCSMNTRKDEATEEKLRCLLTERAKHIDVINCQKQEIVELEEQIGKMRKEVVDLRMVLKTDSQEQEMIMRNNKLFFILENRLEMATKRFNFIVAENERLREEIGTMLKKRIRFMMSWNKLISHLNSGKQIINDLLEQATITFNQQDEEHNRIDALRERDERDLKSHLSEMGELQRTLDNDLKLQKFLGIKGQYRIINNARSREGVDLQPKKEEKQNKMNTYMKILQQIKEYMGLEDNNKLTAHFVKQEEENFALFNYVNELNEELESLRSRVAELRIAIDEARVKSVRYDEEQKEALQKISKELQIQTELAGEAERSLVQCNDIVEKLLRGIESLFKAMRCDNSPILKLLGDNLSVTISNVMLYLGIIEKCIMDMFHKVHWADKASKSQHLRLEEDDKPKFKISPLSSLVPTQPCALCVEKEEMQFVTEGSEILLGRQEVEKRLNEISQGDYSDFLHNVSDCHLPAARKIMQGRHK